MLLLLLVAEKKPGQQPLPFPVFDKCVCEGETTHTHTHRTEERLGPWVTASHPVCADCSELNKAYLGCVELFVLTAGCLYEQQNGTCWLLGGPEYRALKLRCV